VENAVCSICGHSTIVIEGRVACPYCENFYEDNHWVNYKREKHETTDRKTTSLFERLIR
jgi:uncharacterized Zn finger protein (UPF0148 family)